MLLSKNAFNSLPHVAYTNHKTVIYSENVVNSKEMPAQDSNTAVENLYVDDRDLTVMVLLRYKNLKTYFVT